MDSGFFKRLGWYLIGFSIGLVFLIFFIKKKSGDSSFEICYFPNCRVLKDIRSKPLFLNNSATDPIDFEALDDEKKAILLSGNIDFDKSDTKSKPCKTYHILAENNQMALIVENCPDKAVFKDILVIE